MTCSEAAKFEKIRVRSTHDGQVLRVVLASPPANILDARTMTEICTCLEIEAGNPALKAIVFEGEGKHFCFGASVAEHVKEKAPLMIASFHGMFKQLLGTSIPLVALVRGQCLGGGMELALFCSFIIAESSAKFGQPEIQLGVLPPVAAAILPEITGQLRADDLILTGRTIDAETALRFGIVHAVVESAESELEAMLAKHIIPRSASSLRLAYRAVRSGWRERLGRALDDMERLYLDELMATHDANEGIASFLEKRTPCWKNR